MTRAVPALVVVTLLALAAPANAQPSFTIGVGPALESLQPAGGSADSQGAMTAGGTAEYLFAKERARVFYELAMSTYATPGDWTSLEHEAGGRYRFDFGAGDRHHVFTGGSVAIRRNGESWGAADYNAVGTFVNLEFHPSATSAVRTGYRFDMRQFPTYSPLDQREHSTFGSWLVNFPTRTTLVTEAAFGAKHYEGTPAATITVATETSPAGSMGSGATGQGGGQRGTGAHAAGLGSVVFTPVTVPGAPATDARQVTLFVRLAQSLAARTGVSLDVGRRNAFGDVPAAVINTPARFFDDGVYDDPYASDATEGRVSLKSIVWGESELTGFASYQDKPYGATAALDADGAPIEGILRHDKVTRAGAGVAVPLAPARTGAFDVRLRLGYDFTRHESTTAVYNYESHAIGVGFEVGY